MGMLDSVWIRADTIMSAEARLKFSALPHWARFRCSSKWNNGFKQNCVPENKQTGEWVFKVATTYWSWGNSNTNSEMDSKFLLINIAHKIPNEASASMRSDFDLQKKRVLDCVKPIALSYYMWTLLRPCFAYSWQLVLSLRVSAWFAVQAANFIHFLLPPLCFPFPHAEEKKHVIFRKCRVIEAKHGPYFLCTMNTPLLLYHFQLYSCTAVLCATSKKSSRQKYLEKQCIFRLVKIVTWRVSNISQQL